jgi:putative membrane protein
MMNGFNSGMDAGWWVLMSVFWVALIALIVWAAVQLFPNRGGSAPERKEPEGPEEILDRRLARGEIDPETYDALRAKLRGGVLSGR